MRFYLDRGFRESVDLLEKLAATYPADLPVALMLERNRRLVTNPPAADWQGEFIMSSK